MTTASTLVRIAVCASLVLLGACASWAQPTPRRAEGRAAKAPAQVPPTRPTALSIDRFRDIVWQPEDNYFLSPGSVRITLHGYASDETIILVADDAEGKPDGQILVRGKFRLQRDDATLTGEALKYAIIAGTGSLRNADATMGAMRVHGDSIEMSADRGFLARQATFTTCSSGKPHYHIAAREIRLSAKGQVIARGVTLWIGNKPIIAIPWLQKTFADVVESPFPMPGYSKETGARFRVRNEVAATPMSALTYDIVLSARKAPFGNLTFERDMGRPPDDVAPPSTRKIAASEPLRAAFDSMPDTLVPARVTWDPAHPTVMYASVTANTYVYNRARTDIRVSRLPEVGISGRRMAASGPDDPPGWGIEWDIGAGSYKEYPSEVTATRLGGRIGAVAPFMRLGDHFGIRWGVAGWANAYGNGATYALIAPETELQYAVGKKLMLGAGYRYHDDSGATPFIWDRRDVRHELRLRAGGDHASWAYGVSVTYDMERSRAYDTAISVRRRLDCLELGLSYNTRSQGLGLIFNLLPGHEAHISDKQGDNE